MLNAAAVQAIKDEVHALDDEKLIEKARELLESAELADDLHDLWREMIEAAVRKLRGDTHDKRADGRGSLRSFCLNELIRDSRR